MNQLTNEVYRTKKKLELLESEGIGQLLVDFYNKIYEYPEKYIENNTRLIIDLLKQDYLRLIENYKPNSKQSKIEFHG